MRGLPWGFRLLCIGASFALASGCTRHEQTGCVQTTTEAEPNSYWVQPLRSDHAILSRVPQGRITLIRTGDRVLALRLTNVRAAPRQGEMCGCASYDVYEVSTAQHRLLCSGEASDLSMRGIHPIVWNTGNQH